MSTKTWQFIWICSSKNVLIESLYWFKAFAKIRPIYVLMLYHIISYLNLLRILSVKTTLIFWNRFPSNWETLTCVWLKNWKLVFFLVYDFFHLFDFFFWMISEASRAAASIDRSSPVGAVPARGEQLSSEEHLSIWAQ